MAIANGDVIQLAVGYSYATTRVLNVYYYKVTDFVTQPSTGYEALADAFSGAVLSDLTGLMSNGVVNDVITLNNLTNGLDEFTSPRNLPGTVGGDPMAAFVAWAFRLNRATKLTRHGQKRICGVPESLAAGDAPTGAALATLQSVAPNFQMDIEVEPTPVAVLVLSPRIIGRTLTPSGSYVLDLTKQNGIASAEFTHLSTQNSRKFFS